jgi:hypothetical protein
MLPTGREANGVIAMVLMALHASCVAAPAPSVESCRLTMTDIEVLRIGLSSLIQPLVAQDPAGVIVLTTSTLTIPLWPAPPVTLPAFSPPSPPPPFAGSGDHVVSTPEPSSFASLYPPLLSPPERAVWELRNRVARETPGLAIARLGNRHSADDVAAGWTVAAAAHLHIRHVRRRCCTRTTPVVEAAVKDGRFGFAATVHRGGSPSRKDSGLDDRHRFVT